MFYNLYAVLVHVTLFTLYVWYNYRESPCFTTCMQCWFTRGTLATQATITATSSLPAKSGTA